MMKKSRKKSWSSENAERTDDNKVLENGDHKYDANKLHMGADVGEGASGGVGEGELQIKEILLLKELNNADIANRRNGVITTCTMIKGLGKNYKTIF